MASVNKPTDVKQRDADVARKLQFYGIAQAFSMGKMPSNDQIDVALNSFLSSKALANPPPKLSAEGKALVADVRDVVKEAQRTVHRINNGNLLQDFIWQTSHFDASTTATPGAPVSKDTAKMHGNKALEDLRTLGTLIVTNGQFRKLLRDSTTLIRDMAGDAATNAAQKVRPSDEALATMDHPAEDNTWHDAPDLSKANLKQQVQSTYKSATSKSDATAAGTSQDAPEDVAAKSGEAAKAKAQEHRAKAKQYLAKKMPEERRDQVIWRLKKMILECQSHPDYQRAIGALLDLAEEYSRHAQSVGAQSSGTVQDARSTGPLARAEADLKTLLERAANGTSSEPLFDSIKQIYQDADRDPELKNFFRACNKYIRRCLQEEGYILDDASTEEWNRLYDHGNYLLRQKYRAHTERVADEGKFLLNQFDQDAGNQAFAQSLTKLFRDLGNDEHGKPAFKPHLVKDLTEVIIPAILESAAYIPIPRIEYQDPQIDAVIENLVLESDNFMPNVLEVASENFFRWGRKMANDKSKSSHNFDVKVKGVQLDMRDVSYHIKRKQGFPSITDTGVANLKLAGDGLSFRLKMATADAKDSNNYFKVDKVDVDVKHLTIKLLKSNHKFLFNTFKPIMLKVMRPALQKAAEKAIKDYVSQLDAYFLQIKREADRALEEASQSDPENLPNIYSRYVNAMKAKALRGKKKAEDAVADKKVNLAVTREESIFPDIKLPGGISTKATEYRDMARKGDAWESPVFSIGSASKSTDMPKPPTIQKKNYAAHSTPAANGYQPNGNVAAVAPTRVPVA